MNHCSYTVPVLLGTCPLRRRSLWSSKKYRNCISSGKNSQLGGKKKNPLCSYSVNLGRCERNIPCQRLQQKELQRMAVPLSTIPFPFHSALPDYNPVSPALIILGACCTNPAAPLPPVISPLLSASPAPASNSTQILSAGSIKQAASMARSFRLLPRESGISFTTIKSHIFGITLMYKHNILHENI